MPIYDYNLYLGLANRFADELAEQKKQMKKKSYKEQLFRIRLTLMQYKQERLRLASLIRGY